MGDLTYCDISPALAAYHASCAAASAKPTTLNERLAGIDDVDLIFELIARGYAVWKPPVGE